MTYVHRIGRTARAGRVRHGDHARRLGRHAQLEADLRQARPAVPRAGPRPTRPPRTCTSSWTFPRTSTGTLPRAERTRAGLDAEEVEDLGGREPRSSGARSGSGRSRTAGGAGGAGGRGGGGGRGDRADRGDRGSRSDNGRGDNGRSDSGRSGEHGERAARPASTRERKRTRAGSTADGEGAQPGGSTADGGERAPKSEAGSSGPRRRRRRGGRGSGSGESAGNAPAPAAD